MSAFKFTRFVPQPLPVFSVETTTVEHSNEPSAVSRIVGVGALYEPDGLSGADQFYFQKAMRACTATGLTPSRNMTFTALNGGYNAEHDLFKLRHDINVDLLIVFNVPFNRPRAKRPVPYTNWVSPDGSTAKEWRIKAEKINPLAIIAFAPLAEVHSAHFEGEKYALVRNPVYPMAIRRDYIPA